MPSPFRRQLVPQDSGSQATSEGPTVQGAGGLVAEDATHIVMATEYVPDQARTVNANWSTFIGRLNLAPT